MKTNTRYYIELFEKTHPSKIMDEMKVIDDAFFDFLIYISTNKNEKLLKILEESTIFNYINENNLLINFNTSFMIKNDDDFRYLIHTNLYKFFKNLISKDYPIDNLLSKFEKQKFKNKIYPMVINEIIEIINSPIEQKDNLFTNSFIFAANHNKPIYKELLHYIDLNSDFKFYLLDILISNQNEYKEQDSEYLKYFNLNEIHILEVIIYSPNTKNNLTRYISDTIDNKSIDKILDIVFKYYDNSKNSKKEEQNIELIEHLVSKINFEDYNIFKKEVYLNPMYYDHYLESVNNYKFKNILKKELENQNVSKTNKRKI